MMRNTTGIVTFGRDPRSVNGTQYLVLRPFLQVASPTVRPEVVENEDRRADGHESEETDVFGGDDTTHAEAGQEKPFHGFS
jgi:hypothetical protein